MNQDTISAWEKVTRLSWGEGSFLRTEAHHQGRTNSKTGLIQHHLLRVRIMLTQWLSGPCSGSRFQTFTSSFGQCLYYEMKSGQEPKALSLKMKLCGGTVILTGSPFLATGVTLPQSQLL